MSCEGEGDDVHNNSEDLFDDFDEDVVYCSSPVHENQVVSELNNIKASNGSSSDSPESISDNDIDSYAGNKKLLGNDHVMSEPVCSLDSDQSLSHDSGDVQHSDISIESNPCKRHKKQDHFQSHISRCATLCESSIDNEDKNSSMTMLEPGVVNQLSHSPSLSLSLNSNLDHSAQASSHNPLKTGENEEEDKLDMAAKTEEKETEFSCPFCCVNESCLLLLEQHIFTAHPELSEQPSQSIEMDAVFSTAFQSVCPLCDMDLETESALAAHLASFHSEEGDSTGSVDAGHLACPLCDAKFSSDEDMACHVKTHESDSTYYGISTNYAESEVPPFNESQDFVCPMCGKMMSDADLLTSHVETHFSPQHCPGTETVNKENIPMNQDKVPVIQIKTVSTGFDKHKTGESGPSSSASSSRGQAGGSPLLSKDARNYRRQYERSLEQEVWRGKLSVTDYHKQRAGMQGNELKGVDDGHSRVDGLIEQLERLFRQQARPGQRAYMCSPTSHFAGSHGDKGWGCGYRNFQMMLSCLAHQPQYADKIFKDGRPLIPSVPKVQQMIESAWRKGFDPDGCRQLRGSLVNTQKWIGATEIVATLASLGVKCRLADFHAPSAPDGTHPRLLEWVTDYFTSRQPHQFTPPLYLQHQGHSRTIVGVEIDRGTTRLLLFDPGSKKDHIASISMSGLNWKCMRTFRRTQSAFKARQYQIVAVDGILTSREYEASKIIKSERIS